MKAPPRKLVDAPRVHGTSCCGTLATLGEYFCPITLLGDFPVRMSQLEHVGGRAHGSGDDSIDCDSGVRCRFCAGPLGHQARPPRRCEIEEGTVSDFTSSPNQACYLAITRTANLRYGKPRPAGSSPRAGRGAWVRHTEASSFPSTRVALRSQREFLLDGVLAAQTNWRARSRGPSANCTPEGRRIRRPESAPS